MSTGSRALGRRRRGSSVAHRLLVLAAAIGLAGARPHAWAQEPTEKLPKAEEILDQSIEALGGKAALEKLHNRVSKGSFEIPAQNLKGTLVSYEAAPSKYYTMIELPGMGKIESGSDGEVYWEYSAVQGARILEGAEKALKVRDSRFNAQLYWRELYKRVECTGQEDVDGQPCYKIVMTPEVGAPQTMYYSVKTHLPVKADMLIKSPLGEIPVEIRLEDYRKVDGILLQHKVTQRMVGIEQTVSIESVEHNVELPADRFALPAPVKALLEKPKEKPAPPATQPAKP